MSSRRPVTALLMALLGTRALAGEIPFSAYKFLEPGMDEAEVLLRVGPPDHADVLENVFGGKSGEKWSYIPDRPHGWLTIIWLDGFGRVLHIERTRP
jgi:hypothetical protein